MLGDIIANYKGIKTFSRIHYSLYNCNRFAGLMDSSGFRFYYTKQVRKYDTGTMALGHGLFWPRMFIPPKAKGFQIHSYCGSSCTKQVMSQ